MSAYFQRLAAQSSLHVSGNSLSHVPPAAGIVAASGPLEIHAERTSEQSTSSLAAAAISPRSGLPPSSRADANLRSPRETRPPEPTVSKRRGAEASDETTTAVAAERERQETVVGTASVLAKAPDARPSGEQASRDDQSQMTGAPAAAAPQKSAEAFPPDALRAVMKWIAAGSDAPARPEAKPTDEASARSPADTTPVEALDESRPPRETPDKIPERVIHLVQESRPPPAPAAPAPPPPTPARAVSETDTVTVSIGSIHVNVQAPPSPPPSPPRPVRAPAAPKPSSASLRMQGFSRLRRHYILPH